jgi:hypothetical protein
MIVSHVLFIYWDWLLKLCYFVRGTSGTDSTDTELYRRWAVQWRTRQWKLVKLIQETSEMMCQHVMLTIPKAPPKSSELSLKLRDAYRAPSFFYFLIGFPIVFITLLSQWNRNRQCSLMYDEKSPICLNSMMGWFPNMQYKFHVPYALFKESSYPPISDYPQMRYPK